MIRKCVPKNWTSSSQTECSGLKRSFGNFQFVAPLRIASAVLYFYIAWLYSLFSDGLVDISL